MARGPAAVAGIALGRRSFFECQRSDAYEIAVPARVVSHPENALSMDNISVHSLGALAGSLNAPFCGVRPANRPAYTPSDPETEQIQLCN